jgi:hypothetical protein
MDADYDIFEVVNVFDDLWLFDAESYQRQYSTLHSQPLAPGYYVVTWPETIRVRRFNEQASFHGPFAFRQEAHTFLATMQERKHLVVKSPKRWTIAAPTADLTEDKKVA